MAAVRIDLHVHSNASDGTDPPAEVVRRAEAAGLDVLALTDHDTQAGIAEARAALPPGRTLIPGMELSCQLKLAPAGPQTRSVHLLAYLFDPQDPDLRAETAQIRDDRTYRARAMVDKMRELGADVTWEQVSAIADGAVVGRPHLARALAASGAVATPADAFTADWIADGGRAFVDRYAPEIARAVGLVLAAGGVPVLAHPRSPGYEVPDDVIALLHERPAAVRVPQPQAPGRQRVEHGQRVTYLVLVRLGRPPARTRRPPAAPALPTAPRRLGVRSQLIGVSRLRAVASG